MYCKLSSQLSEHDPLNNVIMIIHIPDDGWETGSQKQECGISYTQMLIYSILYILNVIPSRSTHKYMYLHICQMLGFYISWPYSGGFYH